MQDIHTQTTRGILLDGALFQSGSADTALIAITGIHGNFYSNPFYHNIGHTLNAAGIDFIYAQTCDAFGSIRTPNLVTGREEVIGSWNERFSNADEDVCAWVDYAQRQGYSHIVLAGHSLGANKVIYYLSRHHDTRVEHFLLLSPANVDYMTSTVSDAARQFVRTAFAEGRGQEMLPFPLMGWVTCQIATAYDWLWSGLLNNVHTHEGDFSQVERITHTGALLIGAYDNFTDGDPAGFLTLINSHMPTADRNKLIFIEHTGHTYQMKQQELADQIRLLLRSWLPAPLAIYSLK